MVPAGIEHKLVTFLGSNEWMYGLVSRMLSVVSMEERFFVSLRRLALVMKPNTDCRNADPFSRCSAIVCLLSSTPVSQSLELVIACDCENLPPRFFVEKDGRTRRTRPATRVLTFFAYLGDAKT